MARLNHPNIVQVHAVGEHRGMAYVAMEYVEGRSLRARIGNGGIDLETSLRVAADIASALAEAHRRGVVHRDLKPENVMVSNDGGRVRVLDFGLARLSTPEDPSSYAETIPGTDTLSHNETGIAGTPLYMAPEQWVGAGTNTATDVWALGIIIYEMVTGQVPFVAGNEIELSQLVLAAPTPPAHPALPPEIAALVWRCLASQPSARPSAAAVIAELDRIRTNMRAPTPQQVVPATPMTATPAPVVIAAQPPLPAAPPQPRAATSRRWLIAGAAACGAAGMLLAWATRGPTTSEQARRTALDLGSAAVQAATTLAATASAELVQPPPAPDPTPPSSASSRTTVRPETPPRTSTATRIARPPSAPRTGAVPNQPPPSAGF
jgi:serine/threonine-protein kinase